MKLEKKKRLRFQGLEVQVDNDRANEIQLGFQDQSLSFFLSLTFAECRKFIHAIEQEMEWSRQLGKLRGPHNAHARHKLIHKYLGKFKLGSPIKKG